MRGNFKEDHWVHNFLFQRRSLDTQLYDIREGVTRETPKLTAYSNNFQSGFLTCLLTPITFRVAFSLVSYGIFTSFYV